MSAQMSVIVTAGPKRYGVRAFGIGYADQRFERPGIYVWLPGRQFRVVPFRKRVSASTSTGRPSA